MKVLFPRNIEKGLIKGLNFRIGPFTLNLIQLIILTIGGALMLAVVNGLLKKGYNKGVAIFMSSPIAVIFFIIAFFKISELTLIPFLSKMIRNHFFDVVEKFQVNFPKHNPIELLRQKIKGQKQEQTIKEKTNTGRRIIIEKLEGTALK